MSDKPNVGTYIAIVENIMALHECVQEAFEGDWCWECDVPWPCPTLKIIEVAVTPKENE